EVLSGTFIEMFLVSVAGVYLFFVADRYIYKRRYLIAFDQRLRGFDYFGGYVMRASAGVFFFLLWLWYMIYGVSFYITPELKTTAAYIPWLQLCLALLLVSRRTTPL